MNPDFDLRCTVNYSGISYGSQWENAFWTAWNPWLLHLEWPLEEIVAFWTAWDPGLQYLEWPLEEIVVLSHWKSSFQFL